VVVDDVGSGEVLDVVASGVVVVDVRSGVVVDDVGSGVVVDEVGSGVVVDDVGSGVVVDDVGSGVVHAASPGAVLYFPATHAVHVPPLRPVYPALHEQLCTTVLPLAETEFTGHCRHTASGCFHPFKLLQRFFTKPWAARAAHKFVGDSLKHVDSFKKLAYVPTLKLFNCEDAAVMVEGILHSKPVSGRHPPK